MQTSSGRPISTAVSRQMIGTRGNLTSSMGTTAAQGIALSTHVNVSDRPVTNQGMRGMKTAQGPSRQVQDGSYYLGILRQKVTELTKEITTLTEERKKHDREFAEYGYLQKRHEELLREVRNLEGKLADYNLAMDKARVSTDPAELNEYIAEFEMKNKQFAAEIDNIFVMKKQQDEGTKQIEEQIGKLHEEAQRKINDLEPAKLHRYNQLLEESQDLMAKQDQHLGAVDALMGQIAEVEGGSSARQSHAEEYNALAKRRARMHREERKLSEELAIWELPDAREAHAKLKERVENQSKELKRGDTVAKDLREQIKAASKQLAELTDELAERKGESGGDKDKYEKLRQRDDEMTEFANQFEETRNSTLADQVQTQDTIVALLEHISQGLEQEHSMPSQQRLREMRDEATFKERQLESSQQTTQRLLQEKKTREAEMAKIDKLDEKLGDEIESIKRRMEAMRADMIEFQDVDGLRHRAANSIQHLNRLLKDYQGRRESVKAQVHQLTTKYEGLKAKIQASDVAKTLSNLEAKLRTYAQNIFHLQEYVETKGRETDYKGTKENCNALIDKLNAHAKNGATI